MQTWLIMACMPNGQYQVLGKVAGEEDWALTYAIRTYGKNVWIEEE